MEANDKAGVWLWCVCKARISIPSIVFAFPSCPMCGVHKRGHTIYVCLGYALVNMRKRHKNPTQWSQGRDRCSVRSHALHIRNRLTKWWTTQSVEICAERNGERVRKSINLSAGPEWDQARALYSRTANTTYLKDDDLHYWPGKKYQTHRSSLIKVILSRTIPCFVFLVCIYVQRCSIHKFRSIYDDFATISSQHWLPIAIKVSAQEHKRTIVAFLPRSAEAQRKITWCIPALKADGICEGKICTFKTPHTHVRASNM